MEEKHKRLLLIVLCEGLPYGVKVERNGDVCEVLGIIGDNIILTANVPTNQQTKVVNIKPYLRPLSSMTEEEIVEYNEAIDKDTIEIGKTFESPNAVMVGLHALDFLNAYHFDHRGLIPMGLALPAKEGMYKTE